jgi:hypothetical protein
VELKEARDITHKDSQSGITSVKTGAVSPGTISGPNTSSPDIVSSLNSFYASGNSSKTVISGKGHERADETRDIVENGHAATPSVINSEAEHNCVKKTREVVGDGHAESARRDNGGELRRTAENLTRFLLEGSNRDHAKELNGRIAAYCKVERMDNASLANVLLEMGENRELNPLGKALTAALGESSPQQWRDFMRALVAGGKSRNLFSRSDTVVPGLTREQMALAME